MDVGLYLPNFVYEDDPDEHQERLHTWITRIDKEGFDSLWVTDHLLRAENMYGTTWLEPLTTLAYAAGVTERVLLGPAVLLLPLRHPVLLAKEYATMQRLSKGRMVLGAGTGWFPKEFEAVGTTKGVRGRRTDEVLELVRRFWSGERVNFEGEFFSLNDVLVEPSPVDIPVWVGGGSQVAHPDSVEKPELHPRVARRIAAADAWFTRPTAQPHQIVEDYRLLQPYLEEAGKSEIPIVHGQLLHVTEETDHDRAVDVQHEAARHMLGTNRTREHLEKTYLFGTIDEIVEACRERARIGVSHLVLHPFVDDLKQIDLLSKELLPRLKELEVGPLPSWRS